MQERRFFYILPATKNGRFVCEPSVLCNALAKATGEQRANCSALDFLLLLFIKKEKKGNDFLLEEKKQKTTAGGDFLLQERRFFYILPATKNGRFVCEPSVLCNALAKATGEQRANCSALDFLLLLFIKKEKKGNDFLLEEKKQKTTAGGDFLLQERRFFYILPATKNGRFVCEPSVLCNALAKATGEQRDNCSAFDFLLLLFF